MKNKNITNLQIAVDNELKEKAEIQAKKYGFNTVQDLVRFLLAGVNDERIIPGVTSDAKKGTSGQLDEAPDALERDNYNLRQSSKSDIIISRRLRV